MFKKISFSVNVNKSLIKLYFIRNCTKTSMATSNLDKKEKPLQFKVLNKCQKTKARTSLMKLPHYEIELPMFMPVGTQGTIKGLLPQQVKDAGAQIILGNTYHLGTRPGKEAMDKFNGLHNFMQWDRGLLTDSGGFQMVSLLKLAEITEQGVKFQSPFDDSECLLTPEESIEIQNSIGADIMMQLDDVVDVNVTNYERFEIAVGRTTRWLDRCIKANKNPDKQNLFPIIQGGLYPDLRKRSLEELIARDAPGYAIGGLSGGEDKQQFWQTVDLCTDHLPTNKPIYCMGVGYPIDLVVCCALGVDMFDCVYPTRTARFGDALVEGGVLNLYRKEYRLDFNPIDETCECSTCTTYTRSYLNTIVRRETVGCHLLSIHNIAYLMRLMRNIRESIKENRFPQFIENFMNINYKDQDYPKWAVDALQSVNITLNKKSETTKSDQVWDESNTEEMDSGFSRSLYNVGFREKALEDYKDAYEEGRQKSYESAFEMLSCSGSSEVSLVKGYYILSQWDGVLIALHSFKNDSCDLKELVDLRSKLQQLKERLCPPPDEEKEPPEISNINDQALTDYRKLLSDCIFLCQKFDWKVPPKLLE